MAVGIWEALAKLGKYEEAWKALGSLAVWSGELEDCQTFHPWISIPRIHIGFKSSGMAMG